MLDYLVSILSILTDMLIYLLHCKIPIGRDHLLEIHCADRYLVIMNKTRIRICRKQLEIDSI